MRTVANLWKRSNNRKCMKNPLLLRIIIGLTAINTGYSLFIAVLLTQSLITTGSTSITNMNGNIFLVYSYSVAALELISYYGLWHMKKWGYYLYIATYICSLIFLSLLSGSFKLIYGPIFLIVVSTSYFNKFQQN